MNPGASDIRVADRYESAPRTTEDGYGGPNRLDTSRPGKSRWGEGPEEVGPEEVGPAKQHVRRRGPHTSRQRGHLGKCQSGEGRVANKPVDTRPRH